MPQSKTGKTKHSRLRSKKQRHQPRILRVESFEARNLLAADFPLAQTFQLESLPGAEKTIFLDFDGHVTTGTTWNSYFNLPSINSPAYDLDNNPGSFSNLELEDIQDTWQRVAEDFLPFNVNVTTKDPTLSDPGALSRAGVNDTTWGTRVVVTDPFTNCNCGGFAFLNSFNDSVDEPVFVFTSGDKFVAEAASHEVGHALGLTHDGTSSAAYFSGFTNPSWAPIMGVGYYSFTTQWSQGEYNDANNQQDDIAVIASAANGITIRNDDHGDTVQTASLLNPTAALYDAEGIIEDRNDVDVFMFSSDGSGAILQAVPANVGGNLDIALDLYDSQNNYIGTSDPGGLAAGGSLTLPAGVYTVHVRGTGAGTPQVGYSDYGSLGQYRLIYDGGTLAGSEVSISQLDAYKAEGTGGGSTSFTYTVTRNGDVSQAATVDYNVVGVGRFAASDRDFSGNQLPAGTVQFAAGQSTTTLSIPVKADSSKEADEQFSVQLSNPSGTMTIDIASALGYIVADDGTVVSLLGEITERAEGDSGATEFLFYAYRFGDLSGTSSVDFQVTGIGNVNRRADAADFVGNILPSGTVTFAPGSGNEVISIQVSGDTDQERNERFRVDLTQSTGVDRYRGRRVKAKILNDDSNSQSNAAAVEHEHEHKHSFFEGEVLHLTPSPERVASILAAASATDLPSATGQLGSPATALGEDSTSPMRKGALKNLKRAGVPNSVSAESVQSRVLFSNHVDVAASEIGIGRTGLATASLLVGDLADDLLVDLAQNRLTSDSIR